MNNIDRLIQKEAFRIDDVSFINALNETSLHHFENSETYKRLSLSYGKPTVNRIEDLHEFPFFFVDFLKSTYLCSVDESQVIIKLSSSGTNGKKSYHPLDRVSLDRIEKILYNISKELGLVNSFLYNYLCFSYDPGLAGDVGTTFTDVMLTRLTGTNEIFYALNFDLGFDLWECKWKLEEFHALGLPIKILGFPAFIYELLSSLSTNLIFPKTSGVITGGGWKTHKETISKKEFNTQLYSKLGIIPSNSKDLFGMVEHGIPYFDCEYGKFHLSNYSRILVRDPLSLKVVPEGEEGLLQLITPYMNSFPTISLLSTDRVRMSTQPCKCGLDTPYFEFIGRSGITKHQGCAMNALQYLEEA